MAPDNSPQYASDSQLIEVFIEVEGGSRLRHQYDGETLKHKGTRQTSLPSPYPYGFILGTSAADEDCVDCYVVTKDPLKHGRIVQCVPVGLLEMVEDSEEDHKVLGVIPGQDATLNEGLHEELRGFIYGVFAQHPEVTVRVGRILSAQEARLYIQEHLEG